MPHFLTCPFPSLVSAGSTSGRVWPSPWPIPPSSWLCHPLHALHLFRKIEIQALPPPRGFYGSLVGRMGKRKVSNLPAVRTERWERWKSALSDLLVPRHLHSRSLHGQEEPGAPQPIPIEDSSPHLPKGPESAAESRSSQDPAEENSRHEPQWPSISHPGEPGPHLGPRRGSARAAPGCSIGLRV